MHAENAMMYFPQSFMTSQCVTHSIPFEIFCFLLGNLYCPNPFEASKKEHASKHLFKGYSSASSLPLS